MPLDISGDDSEGSSRLEEIGQVFYSQLKVSQVVQGLLSFFCEAVLLFLVFLYDVLSFFPSHGHVSTENIHSNIVPVGHNY